ncbi:MAG: adenosine deaminase [Ilumatobacter sp.]|uniref:adenosine deaminase n=1 Tax=Ilumatobacter sp. TaxID=1967498 RepID=UPI0032978814
MTSRWSDDDVHAEFIAAIPKVELHCHLEGSVPAATFIELADAHGIELANRDPEHVYDFDSFLAFLDLYHQVCASISTPADFERAVYDSLALAARSGNVVYREMFFSPTNHGDETSYASMVDALGSGIEAAHADFGIRCRLIAGINRRHTPRVATELVQTMLDHPSPHVIGIGLDDDEDSGPPEMFVDAYALAASGGLRRTAHAGELGVAANVATSLDVLGCERLDHGYAMVREPAVMQRVRDSGVHVTGAWFVNNFHAGVFTGGVEPASTPLAEMIRTGLPVSLNTDDPTMIPTDLNAEYTAVAAALDLDETAVLRLAGNAIDGAWLDDSDKADLRLRLTDAVNADES